MYSKYVKYYRDELWVTPMTLHRHDHFKPFSRITSLTLNHISFMPPGFPTLRNSLCNLVPTLNTLRLLYPTACPHTLFLFISLFSNLQDTMIHSPSWDKPGNTPVVKFSLCHSELCISKFNDGSSSFLSLLKSQLISYERFTIRRCSFSNTHPFQRFVSVNGWSVWRLQIVVAGHGEHLLPLFVHLVLKYRIQERFHRFRSKIAQPSNKSVSAISDLVPPFTRFLQLFPWLLPLASSGWSSNSKLLPVTGRAIFPRPIWQKVSVTLMHRSLALLGLPWREIARFHCCC